jgi:hypothetical protein
MELRGALLQHSIVYDARHATQLPAHALHYSTSCLLRCVQVGTLLMDLASLELLQRAPAREAQEGPGSSAAAIAARAAAAAARSAPAMGERWVAAAVRLCSGSCMLFVHTTGVRLCGVVGGAHMRR